MWKDILDERSPLRRIESNVHRGVGPGHLGVVVGRPGIGKTAALIQIGINEMAHDRPVLHLTVSDGVAQSRDAYDELIHGVAKACGMEASYDTLRVQVERNRHIHTYAANEFSVSKVREAMGFLKQYMEFQARVVLIDGLALAEFGAENLAALKSFAAEAEVSIWMTVTSDGDGTPESAMATLGAHAAQFSQVLQIHPSDAGKISLRLLKNGEDVADEPLHLQLNATTLLLADD